MTDIVVTWPKSRRLGEYLLELERAKQRSQLVNFRIPRNRKPELTMPYIDTRCYRVHDGRVRGWLLLLNVEWRPAFTVARVLSDPMQGFWPEGLYVVCKPDWHEAARKVELAGFRGWRYFDRTTVGD